MHLGDVVVGEFVQCIGGYAGLDVGGEVIQHLGSQPACRAHALNACLVFIRDGHRPIIPDGPVKFRRAPTATGDLLATLSFPISPALLQAPS